MTKTTLRQDLAWADKQWKQSVHSALQRWLRHEAEDLREAVMPFLEAVCTRKRLNTERRAELSMYVLSNTLPNLRHRTTTAAEPISAGLLWRELAGMIIALADQHQAEQQERPYAEIDEADRTMLRDSDDPTADIVEQLQSESEPEEITEAQVLAAVAEFPKFLSEWNRSHQEPLYQFIEAHPGRMKMLIELQVLLGSVLWEEFMKKHAGETLTIPSSKDYEEFSETRDMFQLLASGMTKTQIAAKYAISPSAVTQRFDKLKARRAHSWWRQESAIVKAVSDALKLMVRAKARITFHMGRIK